MIPALAELPAPPRRIILHWTGGGYKPNPVDLAAYHFVIDREGRVHAGMKVSGNMRGIPSGTPRDKYAAHCAGLNSFSVGISFAAMKDAVRGGSFGPAPLLEAQFEAGMAFVARCCREWGLDPGDPRQLLTHAEVERVYGVAQAQKWDIEVLPWSGVRGAERIGDLVRARVAELMAAGEDAPAPPSEEDDPEADPLRVELPLPEPALPGPPPDISRGPGAVSTAPATLWQRMIRIFRGG